MDLFIIVVKFFDPPPGGYENLIFSYPGGYENLKFLYPPGYENIKIFHIG